MIYYAYSHKDGAKQVALKCGLRYLPYKDYISEHKLKCYVTFKDKDALFKALQTHSEVCAYVLNNSQLYFHPDTILPVVGEAHRKFFSDFVLRMDYS